MSVTLRKGPIIESGLCRCCGDMKRCRLLNQEYEWQGRKEIYSEMFVDCFGLLLSHLDGQATERVICATCVSRLREASTFRRQVLACEEKLLSAKIVMHADVPENAEPNTIKAEVEVKIEVEVDDPVTNQAKGEAAVDDDDGVHCDHGYDDDEDISLANLITDRKKKSVKKKLGKTKQSKVVLQKEYLKMQKLLRKKLRQSKLKEIIKDDPSTYTHPELVDRPRTKVIEAEQKTFTNTVTVVESSYVCPFVTSFSDYYCIYCRDTFTDPAKLRHHTMEHDPSTFKEVYDNKKMAQIDILRIDCRLCPIKINTIEHLKDHLQKAHDKFFYPIENEFLKFKLTVINLTCVECDASNFKFFHALKKHMAEHFGTCICDVCGAHYFEERVLLIHQKTHQKTEQEIYPCNECGKTFKSRHNRYLHESKVHKKEAAYPCSKCDEVFFSYALRYRHLKEAHGEERQFPCDLCDRVYESRKSLREHSRRTHLKILKHQCDLCDRRFYLPSRLKEHMSTHTGERNFRCEYCGKSYPRMRGLKVHMQSHVLEKKFQCMLCSATFTQNANLRIHMKRIHQSVNMDEGYAQQ